MHVLTPMSVSDIVFPSKEAARPDPKYYEIARQSPEDFPILTQLMSGVPRNKLAPEQLREEMIKARSVWKQAHPQGFLAPKAPSAAPAPVGDPNAFGAGIPGVAPEAPVTAPEAVAAPAQGDPAQAIQSLMQSAKQFGIQFNNEIRQYNQHIKQVHQSIAMLQKIDWNTSTINPNTVVQQAKVLQDTLDNATAEKAKDLAFLQQLATQATQLAQSAGGAGQTMEQAYQPQAPQQGVWQRMLGGMPWRASESNTSLTAEAGSAASLLQ